MGATLCDHAIMLDRCPPGCRSRPMNILPLTSTERRSFLLATLPYNAYMVYTLVWAFQRGTGWFSLLSWCAVWLCVLAYIYVRYTLRQLYDHRRVFTFSHWQAITELLLRTSSSPAPKLASTPKPQILVNPDDLPPLPHHYRLKPSPPTGPPVH